MQDNSKYTDIRRLTNSKFLNLYEMDAIGSSGKPFNYYFASRRMDDQIRIRTGKMDPEGVLIYAIDQENPERILMINQYRYPVDRYIYELPAGLIDEGETPEMAAVREIKEETGLDFTPFPEKTALSNPYVLAQGISDEAGVNIFGTVTGKISYDDLEDSERIKAFFVDKLEARRIIKEEVMSLRSQLLLTHFIHSDINNPFAFLDI